MCTPMKKLERQQHSDSGMTSGCHGVPSPSSSAPTSLAAQPVIAQRLRGSPHLMTTEQNRILSTTDKYMKQKNDERAEAQTARLRETAMLAMSSCGIASDFVQVREQEILGQQEIVRKRCEKEGLGFYARVTLFSVQAAKSLYPEMDLTPVSISSPSFVAKVNNSILEGKISIEDCSDSSYLGGAEHLRWAVVNASPVLKVCSVLVLVLVLVLVCSKTCTCILTHIHTCKYSQFQDDQGAQTVITEADARQKLRARLVMIAPSDAINALEKSSHITAFANASKFPYLMRGRGCGGVKCFNLKENRTWSGKTLGDDPKDHVQLMGMLFFVTTIPLKSTGWVVSDEALIKHKKRLAPFM